MVIPVEPTPLSSSRTRQLTPIKSIESSQPSTETRNPGIVLELLDLAWNQDDETLPGTFEGKNRATSAPNQEGHPQRQSKPVRVEVSFRLDSDHWKDLMQSMAIAIEEQQSWQWEGRLIHANPHKSQHQAVETPAQTNPPLTREVGRIKGGSNQSSGTSPRDCSGGYQGDPDPKLDHPSSGSSYLRALVEIQEQLLMAVTPDFESETQLYQEILQRLAQVSGATGAYFWETPGTGDGGGDWFTIAVVCGQLPQGGEGPEFTEFRADQRLRGTGNVSGGGGTSGIRPVFFCRSPDRLDSADSRHCRWLLPGMDGV